MILPRGREEKKGYRVRMILNNVSSRRESRPSVRTSSLPSDLVRRRVVRGRRVELTAVREGSKGGREGGGQARGDLRPTEIWTADVGQIAAATATATADAKRGGGGGGGIGGIHPEVEHYPRNNRCQFREGEKGARPSVRAAVCVRPSGQLYASS